jgi:hypothetical protein
MEIRQFARIAQNYAVRVSDFVRKTNPAGGGHFPLISETFAEALPTSPDRARIVSDCRMINDPAMMSSTISAHAYTIGCSLK